MSEETEVAADVVHNYDNARVNADVFAAFTEQVVNVWRYLNVLGLAHETYLVLAEG